MQKPAEYRHCSILVKELPYSVIQDFPKGPQPAAGVLHIGRVLWLDHDLVEAHGKSQVQAYAEGIGLIAVDPSVLSHDC